ncbi:ArsC/Spx/MgsR family protein [Lactococcus garvieae]|uniref:ArsC/Spx/MgsR family protein n=1 Tax=Lactococcus garvieae TaxID=1363 RepID=UPI001F610716|nr:ArsC/Spx/MgsR family protein [Lactococcus garvieae]MCI3861377.1 hypothetical protein [Lactococcus garvieae]
MVKVYINRGRNKSAKQVLEYLEYYNIRHEVLAPQNLMMQDLKHVLTLTDEGFEDIMVSRYRAQNLYNNFDFDFDELTVEEMLCLIMKHQKLLKTPIVFDEIHLSIGYNLETLYVFRPNSKTNRTI